MLHYLQETKLTNVCNSDLQEIHDMVTAIRKEEEVGVNYMQSWKKEMVLKEEGRLEGRTEGEERVLILMNRLQEQGRTEDIMALINKTADKEALYQEFQL